MQKATCGVKSREQTQL